MSDPLQKSVVRIYSGKQGAVIGAGFLASEKRILTCAHIFQNISDDVQTIYFDFPLLDPHNTQQLSGTLVKFQESDNNGNPLDLAAIDLNDPLPLGVVPESIFYGDQIS